MIGSCKTLCVIEKTAVGRHSREITPSYSLYAQPVQVLPAHPPGQDLQYS